MLHVSVAEERRELVGAFRTASIALWRVREEGEVRTSFAMLLCYVPQGNALRYFFHFRLFLASYFW